jgi:transcriptional regulator with XRE-family HTH domain
VDKNARVLVERIAASVRRLRTAAHMTQEALAERARVAPHYISYIERAERTPSLPMLARLAEALGADAADLLMPSPRRENPDDLVLRELRAMTVEQQRQAIALIRALSAVAKTPAPPGRK